jgi:Rrf2 family protein
VFRINRKTDYSVRVMLCLAKRSFGARLPTQVIQGEMQVPRPFLQRIVADLSRVGLIETHAGPNGGIQLAHPSESINLRHIWEAVEGPLVISDCLTGCDICPLDTSCPVRSHWGRLQVMILNELQGITLEQLAREANQLKQPLTLDEIIGANLLVSTDKRPASAG